MFEKRSLGIAFEADGTVRAAELTASVRSVILTGAWTCHPEGADSFDSWRQALERLRGQVVNMENAVIGIPDSIIYRKNLSFPFSSRRRIMQILNSELEGEIPLPIDDVVADFIPGESSGPGSSGIAMACDADILSRFLEMVGPDTRLRSVQTGAVGLAAASVRAGMKDGVLVNCGRDDGVLIEFRSSSIQAVRRLAPGEDDDRNADQIVEGILQHTRNGDTVYLGCPEIAGSVKTALAGEEVLHIKTLSDLDLFQSAAGVDTDPASYMSAAGLALSGLGAGEAISFDLRQGPYRQVTPLAGLKVPVLRTSALLIVVAFLGLAGLVTSLNQARGEYQGLRERLELEFKELFPGSRHQDGQEAGHIKGELDGLKKKMADLSGLEGRSALSVLAALSSAIPEDIALKLDELSYDSKKLRLEGSVSSFDMVDRIKSRLDSEPLFADVQVQNARVGADINKVTFRLQMEVR